MWLCAPCESRPSISNFCPGCPCRYSHRLGTFLVVAFSLLSECELMYSHEHSHERADAGNPFTKRANSTDVQRPTPRASPFNRQNAHEHQRNCQSAAYNESA